MDARDIALMKAIAASSCGGGGGGGSTIPVLELGKYCQFELSDINKLKGFELTEQQFNEIVELIGDAPIIKVRTDMVSQLPIDMQGNRLQVDIPCMVINTGPYNEGGISPCHSLSIVSVDYSYSYRMSEDRLIACQYRYLDITLGYIEGDCFAEGGVYQYERLFVE